MGSRQVLQHGLNLDMRGINAGDCASRLAMALLRLDVSDASIGRVRLLADAASLHLAA